MGRGNKLIDYLPFYDKRTGEFQAICEAEQSRIDTLWDKNQWISDESFVVSAESKGLERLENMLGLNSKGLEISERRENIIFKLMGDLPYTMNTVYRRIKLLCGENFVFEYGSGAYTLKVRLGLSSLGQYQVIKELLLKILPANISLDMSAMYNTHEFFTSMTHGAMAAYTHTELRTTEF